MNLDLIEMIQFWLMDGSFFWHFDFLLKSPQPFTGLFLHVSVILSTGGCGFPACIAGGIPACLQVSGGSWFPSMPCSFPGPHPGEVEVSGLGGLQAHTQGVSWGVWPGGLQAHTQGEVGDSGLVGSPGPHPGGREVEGSGLGSPGPHLGVSMLTPGGCLQAHIWGGLQAHTQGSIPACTEADSPHEQMATAAGGTHPTGMHSCLLEIVETVVSSCRCEKLSRSIATNESPGREQGTTLWGLFKDLGYNFGGKWHMHL